MKVTVKMSGLIARYLPAGSENGHATVDLPQGSSVAGLIERLGVPSGERLLVIVNDETVPREQRDARVLADDDRVSIVPPLTGG